MAQHDYIIANQSGAAFRADLNNALAAIVSQNSGANQPSVTYAYMPWADTTAGVLKIRNAANSAWVTLYQLDGEWSTIALEDGTAAAPSIYFKDSGTDTGLYSPGNNRVAIATAGVQRVNFNGANDVVFNDGGNDVDFRIEGATEPNLFVIDAGTDQVRTNNLIVSKDGVERADFNSANEVVFNETGADVNFRIEGATEPNLFKIDAGTDQVQVKNLNGGPLAGVRNLLINGNPIINQRGYASGTATSGANKYTLDRWRVVTSGQSITWTDSANVRTVTAPAGGVEQVIEGLNILSGTYTLSWTGTATATVDGSSVTNGGQVTLTGGTNATVRFSGGTFSLAQLEVGTVSTPFERRSYGQELALCQRYYEQQEFGALYGLTISNDSQYRSWGAPFAVTKRAAPSIAFSLGNIAPSSPLTTTKGWVATEASLGASTGYYVANVALSAEL